MILARNLHGMSGLGPRLLLILAVYLVAQLAFWTLVRRVRRR